jgi:hypothetical protein
MFVGKFGMFIVKFRSSFRRLYVRMRFVNCNWLVKYTSQSNATERFGSIVNYCFSRIKKHSHSRKGVTICASCMLTVPLYVCHDVHAFLYKLSICFNKRMLHV